MEQSNIKNNNKNQSTVITVSLRHLRIAPRKVRLMAHLIKNLNVNEAQAQLITNPRRPSETILKLLNSAIAGAKNKNLNISRLVIKEIRVDKGPILKRFMPRAQGRATPIHKVTSHIVMTLAESEKEHKERFLIETKKIKKSDKKKLENKENKSKVEKEKTGDLKEEAKKEIKKESKTESRGFMKRMFRRKSI
jgi:large subunit ribosomal protein L22